MAFDRNNFTDLTALKSEVLNDPVGVGYAASINVTSELLSLLNDPASNPGNETVSIPVEELDITDISAVIDPSEYDALSAYNKEWVKMFINRPKDEGLRSYQTKFLAIFGQGTVTRSAVIALRAKKASRAEVLFGVNTVISRDDLIRARHA